MRSLDKEAAILAALPEERRRAAVQLNRQGERIEREVYGAVGRRPSYHYVLDVHNVPIPCGLGTWSVWFAEEDEKYRRGEPSRRITQQDAWEDAVRGSVLVSTVFLGLDHSFFDGPRHLWETMVFIEKPKHGPGDTECWRYPTHAAAVAGHARVVAAARTFLAGRLPMEEFLNG